MKNIGIGKLKNDPEAIKYKLTQKKPTNI